MAAKKDSFPSPETWLAHRVSYGETDAMGWVYYVEYLHFFERARSQLIREQGMSYAEVERRGIMLPVREASCRYRSSARYDDLIYVRAGVSEWGRASVKFTYQVYDEAKKRILAEGFTHHACVNSQTRPTAVPEWLKSLFVKNSKG